MKSLDFLIVPAVMVLFGTIFTFVGIKQLRQFLHLLKTCTQKTTGYVSEIVKRKHVDHGSHGGHRIIYRYAPVIKYLNTYVIEGVGGNAPVLKEGDKVTVHYDPKNPGQAFLASDYSKNLAIGITFTVLGLLTILSGLANICM